jgi:glyoxylase-like metal-dependent hydrolase (beta-lactamase superfamily II)
MRSAAGPERDPAADPVSFTLGDARFTVVGDGPLALGPVRGCFPGLTLIASPGHSPGHAVDAVATSAGRIVSWGDTCHHEVRLRRPDLGFSADHDSARAARSRRELLARLAAEGCRVHAYHFPHPGIGTVRTRAAGGYAWASAGRRAGG